MLAIGMTVALPDICVSLASEDGRTNGERYKKWCADNLTKYFDFVTPDDLWSMRCGLLHNGRVGDLKHTVSGVIFVPPNPILSAVNSKINGAYAYNVVDFCRNFCDLAFDWLEANLSDKNVITNLPRLMQYRDDIVPGVTVLA